MLRHRLNPCPTRPRLIARADSPVPEAELSGPGPASSAAKFSILVLGLAAALWIAGYHVPLMPARLSTATTSPPDTAVPPGASVGKWPSFLHVIKAINASSEFEYFILRNWESLPGSTWRGSHGDLDIYVSSRSRFAQFIGCEYGGKRGVQCFVSCRDGKLIQVAGAHCMLHSAESVGHLRCLWMCADACLFVPDGRAWA